MEQQGLSLEIQALEAKLEAKKRELAGAGTEAQPERDIFKQVVREHASPEGPKMVNYSAASTVVPQKPQQPLTKDEINELENLVSHAFSKGIASAVAEAKKTNNPYFVDTLHDTLADEYYEKLLAARKINPK